MSAVLILVLAFQMRRIESSQYCQSTILTLMTAVSPVNVVLPSRMVAYVFALGPLATIIPKNDIQILQELSLDFGILPIMMFFAGIGTVFLLTCLAWGAILLCGSVAHKAVMRWAATVTPHEVVAEVAVSTLARFPTILACILIAIGNTVMSLGRIHISNTSRICNLWLPCLVYWLLLLLPEAVQAVSGVFRRVGEESCRTERR